MPTKKERAKAKKRPVPKTRKKIVRPRPRLSPRPRPRKAPLFMQMILLVVSGSILLSSLILPWGSLNVETKLGIIPITLEADLYEYGIKYEADLSGAEGLIQTNMSSKISEEKVFITGLGEFQETVGFVKGSSKYRNHTIQPFTRPDDNKARVLVETYVSNIPWWPVGVAQDVSVEVAIVDEAINISYVEIKKVWFEMHRQVDGEDKFVLLGERSPGDKLKKIGDSFTYSVKMTADEDFGAFMVVGRAEIEMVDKDGKPQDGEIRSFSGNPKMVDLWTVSHERTLKIGMLLSAAPITVVAGALLCLAALPTYLGKRWAWKLSAAGAVLGLLSIIFFMLGVSALIDLTGYGDWFEWNPVGLAIPIIGAAISFVAAVLVYMALPSKVAKVARSGRTVPGPKKVKASEEAPRTEKRTKKGKKVKKGKRKGKGKRKKRKGT